MKAAEVLATMLERNLAVVKMTLGDFTDDEMLVRPVEAANHVAWQLGHLVRSEHHMISQHNPSMPALPDGFADKFTKETQGTNQPGFFPGKHALLEQFETIRRATIDWTRTLSDEQLDQENQVLGQMFPRVHDIIAMQGMHTMMHLGQWQVVRRKLGKPILM